MLTLTLAKTFCIWPWYLLNFCCKVLRFRWVQKRSLADLEQLLSVQSGKQWDSQSIYALREVLYEMPERPHCTIQISI